MKDIVRNILIGVPACLFLGITASAIFIIRKKLSKNKIY